MRDVDLSKGYRKDGVYCFMRQFDLCESSGCPCENRVISEEAERLARIGALLAEEFEEIEREVDEVKNQ